MKPNIELSKKSIALIAGISVAAVVFFLFIWPLMTKVSRISQEVKALDSKLVSVRGALVEGSKLNQEKNLLTRNEISKAINEIINVGAELNINFLSTSPQPIQELQGSKYPVLPIRMEVQSTYEDFGIFLGALEGLNQSIVTIRKFNIERRLEILPKINTELTVDVHLKEGEGE